MSPEPPAVPSGPFAPEPMMVRSADGTPIAVFEVLAARAEQAEGGPVRRDRVPALASPILLVHGATADHTTWRAVGPLLASSRPVFAIDRRGRGGSGDGDGNPPGGGAARYTIDREFEDVAAVAEAIAAVTGAGTRASIDVIGHSYGGRCALGASLRSATIRRLVVYEGSPAPPGVSYRPPGLIESVRATLDAGDHEGALTTFLAGIVGMSDEALAAYRRDPVWPARVRAAPTILREIEAEASPAASLEALAGVVAPVLLILGSTSRSPFRLGTDALAERLPNARVVTIEGAAHAAHHTHADAFVGAIRAFLDGALDGGSTITR